MLSTVKELLFYQLKKKAMLNLILSNASRKMRRNSKIFNDNFKKQVLQSRSAIITYITTGLALSYISQSKTVKCISNNAFEWAKSEIRDGTKACINLTLMLERRHRTDEEGVWIPDDHHAVRQVYNVLSWFKLFIFCFDKS